MLPNQQLSSLFFSKSSHASISLGEEAPPVLRFLTELIQLCTQADVVGFTDFAEFSKHGMTPASVVVISSADRRRALIMLQALRMLGVHSRMILCTDATGVRSSENFQTLGLSATVNRTTSEIGKVVAAMQSAL